MDIQTVKTALRSEKTEAGNAQRESRLLDIQKRSGSIKAALTIILAQTFLI
jgi:hypothetical protein